LCEMKTPINLSNKYFGMWSITMVNKANVPSQSF
jgi:hypothetical protein